MPILFFISFITMFDFKNFTVQCLSIENNHIEFSDRKLQDKDFFSRVG